MTTINNYEIILSARKTGISFRKRREIDAEKSLASAAAAFVLGAGALGGTALAGELVDGGMWEHGKGGGRVWSNYHHPSVNHGSSVNGHQYVDSGCQPANTWARAQASSRWLGADGVYYRLC